MNLKDKMALVWDRGEFFLPFAQALGRSGYGTVLYSTEWRSMAPRSKDVKPGFGMEGVERVDSFWENIDRADTLVFPGAGDGDMQAYLRNRGYAVWGSGQAELLELDRHRFKQLLESIGAPVPDYTPIRGMDNLRLFLEDPANDDSYLKTSFFRGDFETFHHVNWRLTQPWFAQLDVKLGPHRDELDVLVERSVEGIEPGYDGYSIDGQFPKSAMWGWERKDEVYVGKFCTYASMPECLRIANGYIADALLEMGCRGNLHSEVRLAEDGTCYFTDPTVRCGAPPHELMSRQITNWAEIVHYGARGTLVEPDPLATFGVEIILRSDFANDHFLAIDVPHSVQDRVVLQHAARYGDTMYHVPEESLDRIGAALGFGETWQEAAKEAAEVAKQIEAYQLTYTREVEESVAKAVEQGEEAGLSF